MITKIGAIVTLVLVGATLIDSLPVAASEFAPHPAGPPGAMAAFGAAMVPVLFSYGGWQTSSFLAGEVRNPTRNMPLGLVLGVLGVVVLYLSVNWVCLSALGTDGLAATTTPASEVMRRALGEKGGRIIALGIAVSTLGFLSQGMLAAPRVYFAMARDGLFFKSVGWLSPRTRVPVVAIVLQGILASVIALSGRYEQILNYVVSVDWIFFGLTAAALLVFRRRAAGGDVVEGAVLRMPGHPVTTAAFVAVCAAVVVNTVYQYPGNAGIGVALLLLGVPVYFYWRRKGALPMDVQSSPSSGGKSPPTSSSMASKGGMRG
jgi:APA family basic amino acid/polyamine antiporter